MRRVREVYHDATFDKEKAQALFNSGVLSLRERAIAELLHLCTINAVRAAAHRHPRRVRGHHRRPRRRARRPLLLQLLALPVAARQLGHRPALPDHADPPARRGADAPRHAAGRHLRLRRQDRPLRRRKDGNPSLELHPFSDGEPYILGIFLTGAYQEILGDLHNLFGDTNAVHVRLARAGLRDHRPRARRHGDRGAELRAVPRVRPAGHVPPQGAGGASGITPRGGEHVHRRLRRGARRLHVPRGRGGAMGQTCRAPPPCASAPSYHPTSPGSPDGTVGRARRPHGPSPRHQAAAGPRGRGLTDQRGAARRGGARGTRCSGELFAGVLLGGSVLRCSIRHDPVIHVPERTRRAPAPVPDRARDRPRQAAARRRRRARGRHHRRRSPVRRRRAGAALVRLRCSRPGDRAPPLTATSIGISARVLGDVGRLHTSEGQVVLGAAVLDDVVGLSSWRSWWRCVGGGGVRRRVSRASRSSPSDSSSAPSASAALLIPAR